MRPKIRHSRVISALLLGLAGCGVPDPEPGSMVLAPPDFSESWDTAYAELDAVGGLFSVEAEVVGADGAPQPGVRVSVLSGWDGAMVRAGTEPGQGGTPGFDVRAGEWVDLGDCETPDAAPGCAWAELVTNADGHVSFAIFVDVAPDSGASVPIFLTSGEDTESVEIEWSDSVVVH